MRAPLAKLLVALLIAAQAFIGVARGRMICFDWTTCPAHAAAGLTADRQDVCGSCCGHEHELDEIGCGSEHEAIAGGGAVLLHPLGECGCHLHVPIPNNPQVSSGRHPGTAGANDAIGWAFAAATVHPLPPDRRLAADRMATANWLPPPDGSLRAQVVALKATRLLI